MSNLRTITIVAASAWLLAAPAFAVVKTITLPPDGTQLKSRALPGYE